jgi:Amidohydrolase family
MSLKKFKKLARAGFLLLLFPFISTAQSPRAAVFKHVTVIDMTGTSAQPNMTVLIVGNRIQAIGKDGKIRAPKGAQVIDLKDKFLIPGLWDMHVHALWPWRIETYFPLFIANGITGVRDMYGDFDLVKQVRQQIAAGSMIGPRIIASGPIVDGPEPEWRGSVAVSTQADAIQTVDSLKSRGVDFIKVYNLLPRDAYFSLASEAKKLRIPFAGHVPYAVSAAEASNAGQKSIEHLTGIFLSCATNEIELRREFLEQLSKADKKPSRVDIELKAMQFYDEKKAEQLFDRFVSNNTWQCPTLVAARGPAYRNDDAIREDSRLRYIIPMERQYWFPSRTDQNEADVAAEIASLKRRFQRLLELVKTMHGSGVKFMAGTDSSVPFVFPGFSLHDEFELFVASGFTPFEALQTATRNPAEFLGLIKDLGTVEKGKLADLVIVESNPLEDIRNTRKVFGVVINGRYLPKESLQTMLAEAEKLGRG